jgi:hypothetical protein
MFKSLSKSFLWSLLVAASLVTTVCASTDQEETLSNPKPGKLAGYAKTAVSKLPSSHLTLAVGSEIATDFCPTVVTTTASSFATLTGLDSVLSSLSTVPYVGTVATSLNSVSSPIYKFALEETAFFGGRIANRLAGNTQKVLTWTETGVHAVRGGVAVAVVHYAAPVIETYGVELIKTYVSASLSSAAQSVGIPLTPELIEAAAPGVLKTSLFVGVEAFKWGVSAFSSKFLKTKEKKKKD